ncbi:MAG: restriction endonuclease subunit S [Sedimentisphaerales bacterium]|jgi:type I restriction enzyme S subunit
MMDNRQTEWQEVRLGDVIELYDYKRVPLSSIERAERKGEYPYYGASGIIDYVDDYLFDGQYLLIAEDGENLNSRKLPVAFLASGKFWVNNHAHIVRGKQCLADDRFLMYHFATSDIGGYITGTAQPKLSQANLRCISMKLPSFETQQKIASILSAYDDLIENNTRRINILEEMAQAIYHHWFVDFKFPGHKKVKFVDSPLGKIPEGWEVKALGKIADIQWGDTETTKASYVEDGFNAYSASGLDGKLDHYDFDKTGIVLSAIGANCGKTWFASGKWSCIKNTIRLWAVDKQVSTEYLYFATNNMSFWPRRGAAQPFISQGDAENINVLRPDETLMKRFTEFASQSLALMAKLESQNINLRRTWDMLLPKLISGEVDVSKLEIESLS